MSDKDQFRTEEQIPAATDGLRSPSVSVDDRVVSIPDPDEQEPQPMRQPIVSVNGQDLKRDKSGEELPSSKRPAA